MTTLKAIRRWMLDNGPADLGGYWPIASGTATTLVITELDESPYSDEYFDDYYALRAEASSTADRLRAITAFAKATGTFTVATMSDTTFTSETLEVWKYHPRLVDQAINETLRMCRKMYAAEIASFNMGAHWLGDLSGWIEQPSDIQYITATSRPVLSRNRYMENWTGYDTSGNLTPDFWTLTGSGASIARSNLVSDLSIDSRSRYGLKVTRSGTDCYVYQRIPLGIDGISADSLAGETVTGVVRVRTDTASTVRVRVTDGDATTNSSYHTGGSAFEELTAEHTVSSDATYLEIQVRVETNDKDAYIDEAYLCFGTLNDTIRRDKYNEHEVWRRYDQSGSTLLVMPPANSKGSTYKVYALRPYPQLDGTRLRSGAADPDTIDAPVELIGTGALAKLYERLADQYNTSATPEFRLWLKWAGRFEQMQKLHAYNPRQRLRTPMFAGARRW